MNAPSIPSSTLDMPAAEAVARLYARANPRGLDDELWRHGYGCRHWLVLRRHRVTHAIESRARRSTQRCIDERSASRIGERSGHDARLRLRRRGDAGQARRHAGGRAARQRRRCWLRAASNIIGRAGSWRRASRSPTRWSTVGEGGRREPNTRATDLFVYEGLVAEQPEPLAEPRLRSRCGERPCGAVPAGGLLLQDLLRTARPVDGLRKVHPAGRGPGQGAAPIPTPIGTSIARHSATCWWSAAARRGSPRRSRRRGQAPRDCWSSRTRVLGGSAAAGSATARRSPASSCARQRVAHPRPHDRIGAVGSWLCHAERAARRARPSAAAGPAARSACGMSAPGGSCWRPARSSGR